MTFESNPPKPLFLKNALVFLKIPIASNFKKWGVQTHQDVMLVKKDPIRDIEKP